MNWFQERKDFFVKDLVHSFLESKIFFEEIYRGYTQNGAVPFELMERWIGSETKKGPLWRLKDNSHHLFREAPSSIALSEYLFDWALGSIFHEGMKLKEDAYQLEAYLPSYDHSDGSDNQDELNKTLEGFMSVTDSAAASLAAGVERIHCLFSKAVERFKELLLNHAHNELLIRFLFEHGDLLDDALGPGSSEQCLASLYPHQPENAYCAAGKSYLRGGWYEKAKHCFCKALLANPDHAEARRLLKETERKLLTGENR